jgi:hypothetical protein
MPVYTFKSFKDAEKALWNYNPDSDYYRMVSDIFELGFRLAPLQCRRGVFGLSNFDEMEKFKKIELI